MVGCASLQLPFVAALNLFTSKKSGVFGLSFSRWSVGVHISLENRLHPGDVSFSL